ncbi:MAG TPA: hypothetical protein ENN05_06385 [Deltaproteobacteria bacterium]|nr:hypothetical protein [Deltaproteobacteria bacterium]
MYKTDKNLWKASTFILALMLVLCIFWYFYKDSRSAENFEEMVAHVVEAEEYADSLDIDEGTPSELEPIRRAFSVNKGDTFYKIMQQNGISESQAHDILSASNKFFDLSKVLPGHELVLVFSADNSSLIELDYEISDLARLRVIMSQKEVQAETYYVEKVLQPTYTGAVKQIQHTVKRGDNLYYILKENGVCDYQIDLAVKSVKKVYNLSGIVPGNTMNIWITEESPIRLAKLIYEIDALNFLEVKPENASFTATRHRLEVDVRYERTDGSISSSLYESAILAGVSPEVIMELTDIFAWDINFFTDIRQGDTYTVLYEKYYAEETFKGYGRVIAARFMNQGQEHVAVYFNNGEGIKGYYDDKGKPIQKLFLKAPLNYRRISSGFSYNRMHPVYHKMSPHLGVDYAAPSGTPIVALGDGKVIFKGWSSGFGESLRIQHRNGYITYYGHLSRYARGMTKGKHVKQGDVIGYVGMTGVATGPHLDFRVKYNGEFVNPLKLKSVTGPPLKGDSLVKFKEESAVNLSMLDDPSLNNDQKLSSIDKSL